VSSQYYFPELFRIKPGMKFKNPRLEIFILELHLQTEPLEYQLAPRGLLDNSIQVCKISNQIKFFIPIAEQRQ
jgi:hypothetical protein